MRVIAIDPGERRIGVAVSDATGAIALPAGTIARGSGDIEALCQLVADREAATLVVGMPLTLRGEPGPAARKVGELLEALRARLSIEVVTWDERLTTVAADRALDEAGVSTRDRRGKRDSIAATVILQSYLDFRRRTTDTR